MKKLFSLSMLCLLFSPALLTGCGGGGPGSDAGLSPAEQEAVEAQEEKEEEESEAAGESGDNEPDEADEDEGEEEEE